ncbi:MAG: hypothetical protein NW214_05950 [Pseudanabaenaceae cyanobacterium bins.39]|nr:hypothetical protein [Pseudanabaenaceae cyanobacterium bins.39]
MMSPEELTISALQKRVHYLEAHLHLALQVLNEIDQNYQDLSNFETPPYVSGQTIEVVPTSKVELPKFLYARTWKQEVNSQALTNKVISDRVMAI